MYYWAGSTDKCTICGTGSNYIAGLCNLFYLTALTSATPPVGTYASVPLTASATSTPYTLFTGAGYSTGV